ncbi:MULTISPECIES: carbohydrate ABC transporter permease [Amycolatopsis]|uniref:Sugar ABC transporter permease n=2 Tax=Amycolatopsis TaxID=1813 RepID=A0A076N5X8_AMYME|nr:sugar ABC transporter permease [Amycolatopsis methanolica]AIJ26225.1 sugar ABC transporter permease [Amycolatopsis methanolica 239]
MATSATTTNHATAGRIQTAGPRRKARLHGRWHTPYVFLLPALVLLAVFFIWPAVTAVQLAFFDYHVVSPPTWVGLDNFKRLLGDPRFFTALKNSGLFMVGMVPLLVGLPLLLALLVNLPLRAIKVFRLLYYLPVVTSMVVVAIAWNYVFHQRGVLNWALTSVGLFDKPVQFLLDTGWALPALVLVEVWKSAGYYMMIYLAGLQSIPTSLYEAARVDGASSWQRLSHITIPLLRPYLAVVVVLATMDSVQVFTSVFVMTQGGPQDHTMTLGYYIYDKAFREFDVGYANAIGLVLWAILIVFSLVSYRITRGKVTVP